MITSRRVAHRFAVVMSTFTRLLNIAAPSQLSGLSGLSPGHLDRPELVR